jgi:predicted DNA-binding transcriptional regulator YafY
MRRADRLLALMEVLRSRSLIRGSELASELEISLRTVYRDVAALVRIGIPIRGEAGVGYSLEPGYYLPPLNLTPDEAEMIEFGLRLLQNIGDLPITQKALSAKAKIRAVISRDAQGAMDRSLLSAPVLGNRGGLSHDLLELKRAAENRRVLDVEYSAGAGRRFIKRVRPLSLSFNGGWFMICWCEDPPGFRCLRLDRIHRTTPTGRVFRLESGKTLSSFFERFERVTRPRPAVFGSDGACGGSHSG